MICRELWDYLTGLSTYELLIKHFLPANFSSFVSYINRISVPTVGPKSSYQQLVKSNGMFLLLWRPGQIQHLPGRVQIP